MMPVLVAGVYVERGERVGGLADGCMGCGWQVAGGGERGAEMCEVGVWLEGTRGWWLAGVWRWKVVCG